VHRLGYHFPAAIVKEACSWLGYRQYRSRFVKDAEVRGNAYLAQRLALHSTLETDRQIEAAIKDLFPKIPKENMEAIVQLAWHSV